MTNNKTTCPDCNGDGATYEQVRVGQPSTPFVCYRCDGDGEVTDPNIPIEEVEVHALRERLALELARAIALQDALEQAEKRIQAVRDLHRSVGLTAHTGPRIKPGGEPIPDDTQVCDYCTDPDALGWCEYPCLTIEALNGDA